MASGSKFLRKRGLPEDLDLIFLGSGIRSFSEREIELSKRDGWAYVLQRKGTPTLLTEGRRTLLKRGDFLIIHPLCLRGWTNSMGATSEGLVWRWRTPPLYPELRPSEGGFLKLRLPEETFRNIERVHANSRLEIHHPDKYAAKRFSGLRDELEISVLRSMGVQRVSSEVQFELAISWLKNHLSISDPVKSLCRYLQVSPTTLTRIFLLRAKISPARSFQKMKMSEAAQLLKSDKLSVKEIAFTLGYRHASDFSRAYKTSTGRRPRRSDDS
jgi:AraC-like DNA-binding protein